jgi:hypothetical protein
MRFNRLAPFFGPSFDIDGWRTWLSVWPVVDFTMNRAAGFYDFDAQVVAAELLPWSSPKPKPSDPRLKKCPRKINAGKSHAGMWDFAANHACAAGVKLCWMNYAGMLASLRRLQCLGDLVRSPAPPTAEASPPPILTNSQPRS